MKEPQLTLLKTQINPILNFSQPKTEPLQIEAFFESFSELDDKKFNTKIIYKENNIDFICLNGERFNLKLKNKIEKIFCLSEGILIKTDYPDEEFDFFKNEKNKKNFFLEKKQEDKNKFIYYIINQHPLNAISLVKNLIPEAGLEQSNLDTELNIISVCQEIPLLLSLGKNGALDLFCLLSKKFEVKNDFGNYLGKILSSASNGKAYENSSGNFNFFKDNENNFTNFSLNESNFYFYPLLNNIAAELHEEFMQIATQKQNENNNSEKFEINFFHNFSDKQAIYISVFNKENKNLILFKIEFLNKSENYLDLSITHKKLIKDITYFSFASGIFKDFGNEFFLENQQIKKKYFKEKTQKDPNAMDTCYNMETEAEIKMNKQSIELNSDLFIRNYFLKYLLNEEMKIYKKEKKPKTFFNLFYLNKNNELIFIENLDLLYKVNLQEKLDLYVELNNAYNSNTNKTKANKEINIANNSSLKVKKVLYEKLTENFIIMASDEKANKTFIETYPDNNEINNSKENLIPIKFDFILKFDDLIQMKIVEFLKIAFNSVSIQEDFESLKATEEEKIIMLNSFFNWENPKDLMHKIFLRNLFEYINYRINIKDNPNMLNNDTFKSYHLDHCIRKVKREKIAKYFYEFLSLLIYFDFDQIKDIKEIYTQNKNNENNFNNIDSNTKSNINNFNLNQEQMELFSQNHLFNQLIKMNKNAFCINNNNNNGNDASKLKSQRSKKSLKINKIKQYWDMKHLQSNNSELYLLKKIIENKAANSQLSKMLLDFCCELYESVNLFNYNNIKYESESNKNNSDYISNNKTFEINKFNVNSIEIKIFANFLLTNIYRLNLIEKIRYLDFLNYNFSLKKLQSNFLYSNKIYVDKTSKGILTDSDLLNLFTVLDKEKKVEIEINKYNSLTKFLGNFTFGFFKKEEAFKPVFRSVTEAIIIMLLHFSKANSISSLRESCNIANYLFMDLLNLEENLKLNNNFLIANEKFELNEFNNFTYFNPNNLNDSKNKNINLNNFNNTPDNFKALSDEIYETENNNFYTAERNHSDFKAFSHSKENAEFIKFSKKNFLDNFYLYSREDSAHSEKNNLIKITKQKENLFSSLFLDSSLNKFLNNLNSLDNLGNSNNNKFDNKFDNSENFINLKNLLKIFFTENFLNKILSIKDSIGHLFVYYLLTEKAEIFSNNFAVSLISASLPLEKLKQMQPFISLIFFEKIANMKINTNSYKILTENNPGINEKILTIIGRLDMAKNLKSSAISNHTQNKTLSHGSKKSGILSNLLYQDTTTIHEQEYYLANIKFNKDSRFYEALRILNPYLALKVNSEFLNDSNNNNNNNLDPERIEKEKTHLAFKHIIKQLSTFFGAGALNLNIIKNFPKDVLNMKQINTSVTFTHDNSSLKADFASEQFLNFLTANNFNNYYNLQNLSQNNNREKEFLKWPEFHSGVSQAIKLSSEFLCSENSSYIRNWILFNKPNTTVNSANSGGNATLQNNSLNPEHQHGGFIFGMGLLKVLDNLYSTDIYQYMKSAQEGITIGIMLGRAVSKISTMEDSTSRTLCLHVSYLIPASLEINIPMSVQCAAIFSLGLLYQSTCNRLMTEMLLNQIGKKINLEKTQNINLVENYNLCLGFSIGLINLALGNYAKFCNDDLKLEDKLLNFANGGKKFDVLNLQNKSFYSYNNSVLTYDTAFLSGNAAVFQGHIPQFNLSKIFF